MIVEQYIEARITELNIAPSTQKVTAETLNRFSRNVNKNFQNITQHDIITYLNSLRKSEIIDPNHKWIGTYNHTLMLISAFFKWFYYPKMEPGGRSTPDILLNVKQYKRKEKSTYKPSDLWTQDDDILFLKYCSSKRDRCYHTVSRDLSCRPDELLKLKIKDVVFKIAENGQQYAEIVLNGKTGTRPIPLINSIPYVKDWLDSHPLGRQPNAYLICSEKRFTRRLSRGGLYHMYKRYRTKLFPSLLEDPLLDSNEKAKIQDLLKKPWNPYIRRHSALTEKSKILNESILKQHAGWTLNSNMHNRYTYYFGNESSESLLQAYGVIDGNKQEIDKLKPKICPNCREANKIDSKFCSNVRCRMILTLDAYTSATEENQKNQSRIDNLENEVYQNRAVIKKVITHLTNGANRNFAILDSISEVLESRLGMVSPPIALNFTKNDEYYKKRDEMDKILKDIWDNPKETSP
jgi:integrase